MTYGTRGTTKQTEIFLLGLRIVSRSMAWARALYGGIDNSVSEKLPPHMPSQRFRSGMIRSDWMHPSGIASMRLNSGLTFRGSQLIDNSRSVRQPERNEVKICALYAFTAVRGGDSESGSGVQKRTNYFLSPRSRGLLIDPPHD